MLEYPNSFMAFLVGAYSGGVVSLSWALAISSRMMSLSSRFSSGVIVGLIG